MKLIDADALIEQQFKNDISYKAFVNLVKRQPTIEERKKGKWTQILNADMVTHDYRCSECHRFRFHNGEMRKKYNYCPHCGADMRRNTYD